MVNTTEAEQTWAEGTRKCWLLFNEYKDAGMKDEKFQSSVLKLCAQSLQ